MSDHDATAAGGSATHPSILVVGECIVDMHPDGPGSLAEVETFHRRPGGAPANVAVGLARLGDSPALWTRLGDDGFGDFLAGTLADESISGRYVERDPDAPTGLALVSLDADADRGFSLYLDATASTRLQPGRIEDEALTAVEWLHVGGVELAHDPARSAVFDLLDRTPEDVTVSFDPNARPQLWTEFDYAATLREALPLVDVVFASEEDLEPAGLTGDAPVLARALVGGASAPGTDAEGRSDAVDDEALALDGDAPHTALVTRGEAGALGYATASAPWGAAEATHEGFAVDAVDTTGAGDAFTAGAIASLADGAALSTALRFGNAVAAESTTARGAMAALPSRAAVESFLDGTSG